MIKIKEIILKDNQAITKNQEFEKLIIIYTMALAETKKKMLQLQQQINTKNNYNIITNISTRIKEPDSIIEKMQRKGYCMTYKSLIENINDIAGLRIICISEKSVYEIVKQISNMKNINIIKKKDYIKKPKRSGYSAYHVIIEVPVKIKDNKIWVKVEVQIRTTVMDFWANVEHKLRYKSDSKISKREENKLKTYAKILSFINKKMMKMYKKNSKYVQT